MLSTMRTARLKAITARKMAPLTLTQARHLQHKSIDRAAAEAAPVAKQAHYEAPPTSSHIDEISRRRAAAGRLVAGVAAASNSEMFKGSVSIRRYAVLLLSSPARMHMLILRCIGGRKAKSKAMGP